MDGISQSIKIFCWFSVGHKSGNWNSRAKLQRARSQRFFSEIVQWNCYKMWWCCPIHTHELYEKKTKTQLNQYVFLMWKIACFVYKLTLNPLHWVFRWDQMTCYIFGSLIHSRTWLHIFQMCFYRLRSKLCQEKSVRDAFRLLLLLHHNFIMKTKYFLSNWIRENNFVPVRILKNIDFENGKLSTRKNKRISISYSVNECLEIHIALCDI